MATRTIKLIGKAYSTSGDVSLVINFNNTQVFNGTVTTVNEESPTIGQTGSELATWTVDTSVTGDIPLSIAVTGGVFHFQTLLGNYTGFELQGTEPNNAQDNSWADTSNGEYVVTTTPVNYYAEMNHNSSSTDGKKNPTFSDSDNSADNGTYDSSSGEGEWIYRIYDGVTFTCDFVVDSSLVITSVPTPD